MKDRIVIVEDDIISAKILERIIKNLGYKNLSIVSSVEEALLSVKENNPLLVFMDIDLSSSMDGIHTAEIITGLYEIPVIFVTSHFDIKTINRAKNIGIGYITKPFFEKDIEKSISSVIDNQKKIETVKEKEYNLFKIAVKTNDGVIFINPKEILYFEAHGHKIFIQTINDKYTIRSSLKEIIDNDKEKMFFRCHKSFLVNINKIEGLIKDDSYNYKISFKNIETLIPISKDKIKILRK